MQLYRRCKSSLTMAQLMELNRASTHPVPHSILERRHKTTKSIEGFFLCRIESSRWAMDQLAGRPKTSRL